uniref:Uncharacterized protein n=1 Tax=viral metagenome TaxID=1070528 RepID=A0A6M3LV10_9ZZZZ
MIIKTKKMKDGTTKTQCPTCRKWVYPVSGPGYIRCAECSHVIANTC